MYFNTRKTYLAASAVIIFAASALSNAKPNNRGERPHGPPQEAIEACTGLYEGDICSFNNGRSDRLIEGNCIVPKNQEEASLACAPERRQRHLGERPE